MVSTLIAKWLRFPKSVSFKVSVVKCRPLSVLEAVSLVGQNSNDKGQAKGKGDEAKE